MRIVIPPMSYARLAVGRHSSLKHYGGLVKLLALDLCQLVPVNPILVVQFFWKVHPPTVRTLCVLLARRIILGYVGVAPMLVQAGFASASVGEVGAIVNIS
jgi:hypothetical protein